MLSQHNHSVLVVARSLQRASFLAIACLLAVGVALSSATAHGQDIYVVNNAKNTGTGTIGEYTTSGDTVNPSLVSRLGDPYGIVVSGSNMFVSGGLYGTIGEYNATTGAVVNANLVSGLADAASIAVSGSNLFVSNMYAGTIGEYNATTGAVVNANLITGLSDPQGMVVSGSDLFVDNWTTGTIGEYTLSGAVVNASLFRLQPGNGNGQGNCFGIVQSGTNLFVTDYGRGTIGEYTTSGDTVNPSLISGLNLPLSLGISGSDLFVVTYDANHIATIGEYTTSGDTVNPSLVSGLDDTIGIAVTQPVPEPTSLTLLVSALLGLAGAFYLRRRRAKA